MSLSADLEPPEREPTPDSKRTVPIWRRRLARTVWQAAQFGDPLTGRWSTALAVAAAFGVLPVMAAGLAGSTLHQPATALLLAPLVWSCARREESWKGMAILALTFACHSATMITHVVFAPEATAAIVPDGDAYWDKQWTWITTGQDPEYSLAAWVPAHLQLAFAAVFFAFTSLGAITLHQGLYEVDLMNFYNGQLFLHSENRFISLALGWHPWSVLRGLGYVVLTYEIVALSIQFFALRPLGPWRPRMWRWGAGAAYLLADAFTKILLLEPVRAQLQANLV